MLEILGAGKLAGRNDNLFGAFIGIHASTVEKIIDVSAFFLFGNAKLLEPATVDFFAERMMNLRRFIGDGADRDGIGVSRHAHSEIILKKLQELFHAVIAIVE